MASLSAPGRPQTSAPSDGSRTLTLVPTTAGEAEPSGSGSGGQQQQQQPAPPLRGVLKLRGGPRSRPQVQWTEETVDNEGAGRKKSKICCIYHKPRAFDESSSEESSSDDEGESDAGGGGDCGARGHSHHHHHGHAHSRHSHPVGGGGGGVGDEGGRGPPNAYEKGSKGKSKAP